MTVSLFSEDAYLRSCSATVLSMQEQSLLLDQTVFYPRGGGQPGDTGEIHLSSGKVLKVLDTVKGNDGSIVHQLDQFAGTLEPGTSVEAVIDWERRYAHMKMHTALHLLGVVLPYGVTGGAITAQKSRLDFDMTDPVDKDKVSVELNRLVTANHDVQTQWITEQELAAQPELIRTMSVKPPVGAGQVRLLKISDIDLQPCGGTHVAQTGEIGPLLLGKVEKKGARNRRVNILFGQ
ncbi:MAG: alanyl-tRNA editing protein [Gammaproteobacteria bacterium]|nr:alanyl-tRNA editing protein [Gammaproteobacteria bacterium]